MTLTERLIALHKMLDRARVPHAFGGAIALAYWTLEPRGTRDLDLNIFQPAAEAEATLSALSSVITVSAEDRAAIARDEQVRLWWDDTPVDLFFDYAPIHTHAAEHTRLVPFAGSEIPVLGPVELAAFKVMFDRTKDWADIEAMLAADTVSVEEITAAVEPMLAGDDHRLSRLGDSARRARG